MAGGPPAAAQEKPLRIGVLAMGPRKVPILHCGPRDPQRPAPGARADAIPSNAMGFRDELEKLGYVEERPESKGRPGPRFVLDIRQGNTEAVKRFAQQFAQERVDLIFAISNSTVRVAQEATRANPIPILFPNVSDPVSDGFATSLARPGGYLTGVSTQLVQGAGKRVEVFKEIVPRLRRLLTTYQPEFRSAQLSLPQMREAAAALGITLSERHANTRAELQAALADVRRDTMDGIIMTPDAVSFANADLLLETSHERRVPVFGIVDFMADWGALGAYGPSDYQAGRRVAHYADKIFRGTKPGDLPIEPSDPTFVVNLKAAACMGVAVPPAALHQADRVIR
jgi:putative ABC transport system substrate-binding protein